MDSRLPCGLLGETEARVGCGRYTVPYCLLEHIENMQSLSATDCTGIHSTCDFMRF